jgi:hypothetical protein
MVFFLLFIIFFLMQIFGLYNVYVLSAAVFNRIIRHADCTLIVT